MNLQPVCICFAVALLGLGGCLGSGDEPGEEESPSDPPMVLPGGKAPDDLHRPHPMNQSILFLDMQLRPNGSWALFDLRDVPWGFGPVMTGDEAWRADYFAQWVGGNMSRPAAYAVMHLAISDGQATPSHLAYAAPMWRAEPEDAQPVLVPARDFVFLDHTWLGAAGAPRQSDDLLLVAARGEGIGTLALVPAAEVLRFDDLANQSLMGGHVPSSMTGEGFGFVFGQATYSAENGSYQEYTHDLDMAPVETATGWTQSCDLSMEADMGVLYTRAGAATATSWSVQGRHRDDFAYSATAPTEADQTTLLAAGHMQGFDFTATYEALGPHDGFLPRGLTCMGLQVGLQDLSSIGLETGFTEAAPAAGPVGESAARSGPSRGARLIGATG